MNDPYGRRWQMSVNVAIDCRSHLVGGSGAIERRRKQKRRKMQLINIDTETQLKWR